LPAPPARTRSLGIVALIGIVVAYLVILQGLGLLLDKAFDVDAKYASFPTIKSVLAGVTIPVAVSVLFIASVVTVLGWWPRVMRDEHRVNRWVWLVPIALVATSLVMVDYGNLADIGIGFTLTLLVGSLLVGIGEELTFRGLGVQTFRAAGLRETRVALWSSVLFGAAHITNIITEGPGAFGQVVVVSISGFFFYLTLRVSGSLVLCMVVHALWDFSLFSASVGPDGRTNPLALLGIAVNIVLAIVLLVRRHKIGVAIAGQAPTQVS
jgi:membrane protease YdiL (CAAX protease family)